MSAPFVLLPYQQRWVADESRVQVAEKSRRIGVTWASALRAVLESAVTDGWDTYYTGYRFELAEEFIRNCADFARALHIELAETGTFIFEDTDAQGEPKGILAYQIRFASGFRIVALSSSPRNLRGIQGRIIIDEAAFHDNLPELMKAAMATLMWGGKVSIISTHNGEENAFNRIIQDTKAGRFSYTLHRTTLDDALSEGLYERIALVTGADPDPVAREKWRTELVEFYGDGADEELFCTPRRSGGVYISPTLVEACMDSRFTVIRLKLDDDFAILPEAEQALKIQPWLDTVVLPELKKLDPKRPVFIGEDFGRRSDLTAIALGQEQQDLAFHVPLILELRNFPFKVQETVMLFICQNVPKLGLLAVDSSGNGMSLGETLANHYGDSMVHRIGISVKLDGDESRSLSWPKWYADNLPKFKASFEDQAIRIPKDYDVRADLTAFTVNNGVPSLPRLKQLSKAPEAGPSEYRHGDAAVALALCDYAKREGAFAVTPGRVDVRGDVFHEADKPKPRTADTAEDRRPTRFRRKGIW
jgi:phage FluMu gp28-like protein